MKTNKFLTAAVVAAMMFSSCSKDDDSRIEGPEVIQPGVPTYATFHLNFGAAANSRAIADFDPANVEDSDVDDARISVSDMTMLIFNATTGAVEYTNNQLSGTTETVLLTSGPKKIFVFANTGNLNDYYETTPVAGENLNARIADFTVGGTRTLSDFNALAYNAGTPQQSGVDKVNTGRTYGLFPLYTQVTPGTLGLPMSNSNAVTYNLKPDVTEDEAAAGASTASDGGDHDANAFNIRLKYMTAKGRLLVTALSDGANNTEPIIADPMYTIKNLAKYSYYTQHVSGNIVESYYFNRNWGTDPQQTVFNPEFDYASNLVAANAATPSYLYVPENNANDLLRGQSSYYALQVTYKPNSVVSAVTQDASTLVGYTLTEEPLDAIGDLNSEGPLSYIYLRRDIAGIPAFTYFKNMALLQKAVWISNFGSESNEWVPTQDQIDAAVAEINAVVGTTPDNFYFTYPEAKSWYRLDMGSTVNGDTTFGVLRSNKYTATVTQINGPGFPNETGLEERPWDPVQTSTNISATIVPAEWTAVEQSGTVE